MYGDAEDDVYRARFDIGKETSGEQRWISGHPSSQALMMANKKQNRFEKNKVFNGFVLDQQSPTKSEFLQFLTLLKQNVANIPPNTRLQLAVRTNFVDDQYDVDFRGRTEQPCHWTSVDIFVGENGQVNSFVLDAANSVGYPAMHAHLQEFFPDGKHYVFEGDTIAVEGKEKLRLIQTQTKGCQVFVTDHLRQLSQIDSSRLYDEELPKIATDENEVYPENFEGNMKLTRIFRGMQSWSGLNAFSDEVRETAISDSKPGTLKEHAERWATRVGGLTINSAINKKNEDYKTKKKDYFESVSPTMQTMIMEQRQGFTFLKNPSLLQLSTFLATPAASNMPTFIEDFTQSLKTNFRDKPFAEKIASFTQEMEKLSRQNTPGGAIKNDFLLSAASLFKSLEENNRTEDLQKLAGIINTITAKTTACHHYSQNTQELETLLSENRNHPLYSTIHEVLTRSKSIGGEAGTNAKLTILADINSALSTSINVLKGGEVQNEAYLNKINTMLKSAAASLGKPSSRETEARVSTGPSLFQRIFGQKEKTTDAQPSIKQKFQDIKQRDQQRSVADSTSKNDASSDSAEKDSNSTPTPRSPKSSS